MQLKGKYFSGCYFFLESQELNNTLTVVSKLDFQTCCCAYLLHVSLNLHIVVKLGPFRSFSYFRRMNLAFVCGHDVFLCFLSLPPFCGLKWHFRNIEHALDQQTYAKQLCHALGDFLYVILSVICIIIHKKYLHYYEDICVWFGYAC